LNREQVGFGVLAIVHWSINDYKIPNSVKIYIQKDQKNLYSKRSKTSITVNQRSIKAILYQIYGL